MKTWLLVPLLALSATAYAGGDGKDWTTTLANPKDVQRTMRQISRPLRVLGKPYRGWQEGRQPASAEVLRLRGQVSQIAKEVRKIQAYRPTFLGRYEKKITIALGYAKNRLEGVVVARTPDGKRIMVDRTGKIGVPVNTDFGFLRIRGLSKGEAAGFDLQELEQKQLRVIEILKDPQKAKDGEIELVYRPIPGGS